MTFPYAIEAEWMAMDDTPTGSGVATSKIEAEMKVTDDGDNTLCFECGNNDE